MFLFDGPAVFEAGNELGEITGLYMIDEEGEMASVDVNAKFVNGKPSEIECKCGSAHAVTAVTASQSMLRLAEHCKVHYAQHCSFPCCCRYVMRSSMEWDRFMRFMERYAEENNLGFKGCVRLPALDQWSSLPQHASTASVQWASEHHCMGALWAGTVCPLLQQWTRDSNEPRPVESLI